MKMVISTFQIIGALLLTIGLFVGYNTINIFYTGADSADLGSGFLFYFVSMPGIIIGTLTLLICQALLWRLSK